LVGSGTPATAALQLQMVCRRCLEVFCQQSKSIGKATRYFDRRFGRDHDPKSRLGRIRTTKDALKYELIFGPKWFVQNEHREMSPKSKKLPAANRTSMTRAALELAIVEAIRTSSPECGALIGIIVERVIPKLPGGANWAVKGIKFGKADRAQCSAAISKLVEDGQLEFEISD
jgi:hypothetical protein